MVSGVRFQVSVNPESGTMATDLVAAEGQQHRRKKAHFMSDSDIAGRVRLLTPDTRNLNIADKRYHPYNPSGVA